MLLFAAGSLCKFRPRGLASPHTPLPSWGTTLGVFGVTLHPPGVSHSLFWCHWLLRPQLVEGP